MKYDDKIMEIARKNSLPANVVAWRLNKGFPNGAVKAKLGYHTTWMGVIYTASMLADKYDIPVSTVQCRLSRGEVMPHLVRPTRKVVLKPHDGVEKKKRAIAECRIALSALVKAHRDRAQYVLEHGKHFDDVDDGGHLEGAALANASRLYAAGRAYVGAGLENTGVYHG